MNVGDPKKAAVLGVVALVIVGVAVVKSIPKGDPKPARPAPTQTTPEQTTGTAVDKAIIAAESLKTDPFAHPSLESEEDKKKKDKGAEQSAPTDRGVGGAPPKEWGGVPYRPTDEQIKGAIGGGVPAIDTDGKDSGTSGTSGNTGKNQESQEKGPTGQLLVEGTISVNQPKAFISINAEEAGAYKVGDKIKFKVGDEVGSLGRITRITENEVVIDRNGKKHVLPVGRKVDF